VQVCTLRYFSSRVNFVYSRPYLSNGRAFGTVVVRLSVVVVVVCNGCIVAKR